MIALSILIATLVGILLWYLLVLILWIIRATKLTGNIIGPKPLPIVGNALYFLNTSNLNDFTEKLINLFKMYFQAPDKIFKFWLGPRLLIAIANPEYIEATLSSDCTINKGESYSHCTIASDGIFSANGQKWVTLRKMLNPYGSRRAIEPYLDIFHEKAVKLGRIIDSKVDKDEQFNIKTIIAKCTLDMLMVSNYGSDVNEMENDERPETLDEIVESTLEMGFKLAVQLPTSLSIRYSLMTSLGKELAKKSSIYWNLMAEVLQSRKKQTDRNDGINRVYADVLIQKAEMDKLSWEATGKLTTDYLIAGSHSVSIMTATLILMLAIYPEHQEAVYQEQLEVLGDDPEVAPTWEQLSKMTYLTRVFKEIVRFFTVPFITREVNIDFDLGKHKLPKGSEIILSIYSLHRDPTIWSHPEEFYPDHFLPEETAKRPKNSYLPFSWGPRNCPGSQYALIVAKTIVSALVRMFYFKTDLKFEELNMKYVLFLDISEGHMVRKVPRNIPASTF